MIAVLMSGSFMQNGGTSKIVLGGLLGGLLLSVPVDQARAETAESLLANPQRFDLVQAGCKAGMAWTTTDLCAVAAQATRMRFQGGGVPCTPHTVDLFPTHPAMSSPTPQPAPSPPVRKPRPKARGRVHRLSRADARLRR